MRTRYQPRLTWKPVVRVKHRRIVGGYGGEVLRGWRLYLFGIVPLWVVPGREG